MLGARARVALGEALNDAVRVTPFGIVQGQACQHLLRRAPGARAGAGFGAGAAEQQQDDLDQHRQVMAAARAAAMASRHDRRAPGPELVRGRQLLHAVGMGCGPLGIDGQVLDLATVGAGAVQEPGQADRSADRSGPALPARLSTSKGSLGRL